MSSKLKFDPYKILNIPTNATVETINKEYKKLAILYHPDKNTSPDANEKFQNIKKAKDILTDSNKRSKYDKYGICDDNDEHEMQEKMAKEMMIKQQLNQSISINIPINSIVGDSEVAGGYNNKLNIDRNIINSATRKQTSEKIFIDLNISTSTPINRPIVFENKGTKYDDLYGDLNITVNIMPNNIFRLDKSNYNLITKQKITFAQSICGFELSIPFDKKNLLIQHNNIIKNNYVYFIKNQGLTIIDDNNNLSKTDIEVHFEIEYPDKISNDDIEKLKNIFKYNPNKNNIDNAKTQIVNLESKKNKENDSNNNHKFEQIFTSGSPFPGGFPGGFPGFQGGFPGGGMRQGNTQECHVQ
jgi:DnaJ-class molecular chaperone